MTVTIVVNGMNARPACGQQFDDLSGTIFQGHHQPLRVRVTCVYFMGLNLSNEQIAAELGLSVGDAPAMTMPLCKRIVEKRPVQLKGEVETDEEYIIAGDIWKWLPDWDAKAEGRNNVENVDGEYWRKRHYLFWA